MVKVPIPQGFISLHDAYMKRDARPYNTMGICIDHLPPTKTSGTDFTCKFNLNDPSWEGTNGMTFRYFQKTENRVPSIETAGDVVILHNMKTKAFNSDYFGISNHGTSWVVVSGSSLADSKCPQGSDITYKALEDGNSQPPKPSTAELLYAKALANLQDRTMLQPPARSTALQIANIMKENGGDPNNALSASKQRWLKDLEVPAGGYQKVFADLLGEVRKYWIGDFNVDLKVTDYTEHPMLYNFVQNADNLDGDPYGHIAPNQHWVGPWGRRTITLTLWDHHADWFSRAVRDGTFKPGMFLGFKNVHIKMDKNGSHLEGHCRDNKYHKNGLSIHKPHEAERNPRLNELLQRKRQYERLAKEEEVQLKTDPGTMRAKPAPADDPAAVEDEQSRLETKKRKRNARNKGKNKKRVTAPDVEGTEEDIVSKAKASEANSYVRCVQIDIPLTRVDDILDPRRLQRVTPKGNTFHLPFQNCKYKTRVRIFDFFPDNLADFAQPYHATPPDLDNTQSTSSPSQKHGSEPVDVAYARRHPDAVQWRWHFFLWVRDPHPSRTATDPDSDFMLLQVADEDGDHLLDSEACDLRRDARALARLTEKLFVLWGDLHEKKGESGESGEALRRDGVAVSSRPFECFVKEYGVPLHGRDEDGGGKKVSTGTEASVRYERMFRMFGTTVG